jgi:hypothetical protein
MPSCRVPLAKHVVAEAQRGEAVGDDVGFGTVGIGKMHDRIAFAQTFAALARIRLL